MGELAQWVSHERSRLVWLELEEYARTVFAGDSPRWYSDPLTWVGAHEQALRIVPSDVVTIPLGRFVTDLISRQDGELSVALTSVELRDLLEQIILGLHHQHRETDLALLLPRPRTLLALAGSAEPSRGALDDIGFDLADLVRSLNEAPLAALVITEADQLDSAEVESIAPVLTLAGAYGWLRVARGVPPRPESFDLVLPHDDTDRVRHLPATAWEAEQFPEADLVVGSIDPDVTPEQVVKLAPRLFERNS